MNSAKIESLESLRGIAAVLVATFHFQPQTHVSGPFIERADLMVDFFFVLSGFVIALNYHDRLRSVGEVYQFQRKRFWRLYPLHCLMLFVFLMIEVAKYLVEIHFNINANNPAFSQNNFGAFVSNLLMIHNWTGAGITFNTPSWSISAEFFTYLIYAISVFLTRSTPRVFYLICTLIIVAAAFELGHRNFLGVSDFTGPLRCLFSFFIGVVTVPIFNHLKNKQLIKSSATAVILLSMSCYLVGASKSFMADLMPVIPIFFALVILVVALSPKTTLVMRALTLPFLVHLGTISYGIYMIHNAVWWFTNQLLRFVVGLETTTGADGKIRLAIDTMLAADAILISGLLITIVLANLSHRYFETRYTKLA